MSSFPFSASSQMRHRWSQPQNPKTPGSTTPQQQGQRRVTLPAVRKAALVVVSVAAVFLLLELYGYVNMDLRIYVQPSKRGEQQLTHPLVQSNHNVQPTKKQPDERGTIQQSTNSSFSSTGESTSTPWFHRTLTMVVRMKGQMSNQLLFLAHARQIQHTLEAAVPGLVIRVLAHKAHKVLPQCFPGVRTMDFVGSDNDSEHFGPIQEAQTKWLSGRNKGVKELYNVKTPSQIQLLRDLLKEQYEAQQQQERSRGIPNKATHDVPLPSSVPDDNPYSIPFLSVSKFLSPSVILQDQELYYDLRHWFRIDPSCCAQRPNDNETVFHFRNFVTEFERINLSNPKQRYRELTPADTAQHLFGPPPPPNLSQSPLGNNNNNTNHTHSANQMAIISRYPSTATPYAQALTDQGWMVRVIQNQSGIQDFCLALSTKATLVGVAQSTFAQLAGLLGNASTVRWYYLTETMGDQASASTWFQYHPTNTPNNRKDNLDSSVAGGGLVEQNCTFLALDPSMRDSPRREFCHQLVSPSGTMTGKSLQQQSNALL